MFLNQVCVFRFFSYYFFYCLFIGICIYYFVMKYFVEYLNKYYIERNYFLFVFVDFWGI